MQYWETINCMKEDTLSSLEVGRKKIYSENPIEIVLPAYLKHWLMSPLHATAMVNNKLRMTANFNEL